MSSFALWSVGAIILIHYLPINNLGGERLNWIRDDPAFRPHVWVLLFVTAFLSIASV